MGELDFTFSKDPFAPHKLLCEINWQYEAIMDLISENQNFFSRRKKELEHRKNAELSKIHVCEHNDVPNFVSPEERSIMENYEHQSEVIWNMENYFCHSALMLTYSYFESIVLALQKEKGRKEYQDVKKNIDGFLSEEKMQLTEETQEVYEYVTGDLKNVRNLLTHNYNGTAKECQLESARKEAEKGIGLNLYNNELVVIEYRYVTQALEKVHKILLELAKVL